MREVNNPNELGKFFSLFHLRSKNIRDFRFFIGSGKVFNKLSPTFRVLSLLGS